jgi:hypothetical protein
VPAVTRARAGTALGSIGDPRFHGPKRWHLPNDLAGGLVRPGAEDLLGFVLVDPPVAGWFDMGSAEGDAGAYSNEKPLHPVPLVAPFYLARYPVTGAQYSQFVGRTPHDSRRHRQTKSHLNHPATHVSWFDAMDYCQWLTSELHKQLD